MAEALRRVFESVGPTPALEGATASLSYAELAARSADLAVSLIDAGVASGDVVPVVLPRSIDMIVAMVALVRIGATYAPIDPAAPPLRIQGILAALHARVGIAATPTAWLDAEDVRARTLWLPPVPQEPLVRREAPWHAGGWDDALYIMFTSGSTGAPKGVVVPARGIPPLVRCVMGARPLPHPRWSHASSPAFDISNLEIWGALLNGGCCVVQDEPQPSLDDLARFFRERGVTHGQLSTGIFNAMVEDYLPCFAGLRQMVIGGDRASPDHVRAFMLAHPHVRFINGYGPTETTIYSLLHEVRLEDTTNPAGIPIGRPVEGTVCRVVPHGADNCLGELWHAGACVSMGYFERPDLTSERFINEDHIRWYRTGDLVRQRLDGVYESHGRADRQVKVQGVRIELDEVELAIGAFPGVDQAVAFVRGASSESTHLVAWYSGRNGAAEEPALRAFLALRLPAAAVPRYLLWRPTMPTNLNGKVDRALLARAYDEHGPALADAAHAAVPRAASFVAALREALQQTPALLAVEGRTQSFTYAGLNDHSARAAAHLRHLGVHSGDTVALVLPRSAALVAAMVGVLRCGAVYAPLSVHGSAAPLEATLAVLSPVVCVVPAGQASAAWPIPKGCRLVTVEELFSPPPTSFGDEWALPAPTATACIMFTSGSTGEPKGVCVPQAGLLRLVQGADHAAFAPGQRWAFWSPPAFDAAHLELWAPLLNAGTCVVLEEEHPSLDDLAAFLHHQRISDAWLTSSLFNAMVDAHLPALCNLAQLLVGGERLSRRHVAAFLAQAPAVALINGYGPTENTTFTTCHRIAAVDLDEPVGIPIGRAVQGTLLRIESIAGDANEGELWAGGSGVANGYLHNAPATAERFVVHDGQRWYRTGDLVRQRADGVLLYLGRTDRQIKLQGHRIELDAVESALCAHAGVREAVVLVVGDEAHDRYLVAAYSHDEQAEATPAHLTAWLQQRLPLPAVPRVLQPMRNLPRTANGKVDRDTVRQCLLAPRLSAHPGEPLATVLAPDDPPLQPMLALWRRLLGSVPADPSASFTQLGGTSVLALLLATAIRRELKRRVSAVELLRRPLLQDHVDLVARTPPEGPDSQAAQMPMPMPMHVPTAANEGWLTEVQVSLLMAAQLDDGTGSMLLHVAVCLPPGVTSGALKHAFATVVQRHPMLRLSVQHAGQGVQMRLLDALPPPWWTEHTAVLEQFPGDLAWPAALLAVVQRPLDLVEDGPMRVDLWPVARGGHLMVWTVHHFATDEIGIDNALHELDVLLQGQALPPVYGSPFAFSVVERSTIDHAGIRLKAQALAPDLGRVQLPFEHRGQLAGVHLYSLPAALADALRAATVRWQCTPFAPLLTAYGLALQSVFGQGARHVLTPVSRRSEPQLLEPITYFLDLRFMEAGARAGEGAAAHLQRVQLETLQAQQPACQPLPRVSQALAAIDPAAAQRTTAFVFTWREAPARSLRLGGVQARLIRAPQRGAKFGMALHAAMVDGGYSLVLEAAEPAHQGGWTGRVWQAFCRHLGEVCAVDKFDFGDAQEATTQAPAQPTGFTPAFDDPLRMLLAAAWRRWAPMTPPVPANEASFVALGWLTTITLAG